MQVIFVKVLPTTATRPARIVASCQAGRLVRSFDGEQSVVDAVCDLVEKLSWSFGDWVGGEAPGGWVFTCRNKAPIIARIDAAHKVVL